MLRRSLTLTSAAATAGLALTASADAQSRCGDAYRLQPGDTLYRVSQSCRVPLSLIMDINPGLDPRDLPVGESITLAASDTNTGGSNMPAPARETYEIREGDTAFSIAQTLGISVVELLNENPDLDPLAMAVGDALDLPDASEPSASVRVQPLAGPPGSEVRVTASNLRPADYVTIGVGRMASEWRAVDQAQVAADGEVSASVELPDWASPGDNLIFVVDTDRGVTLKSRAFDVVSQDTSDGGGDQVSLEGRVRQGVECATLTTPDGDVWSLTGDMEFTPGEYAELRGTRAEMSFCQQGVGTVAVDSYEEFRAPGNLPDDTANLDAEGVQGPWVRMAGNCARPDFDITGQQGRLTIETSLDGAPRTGRVKLNDNGAAAVFDQPYRAFPMENRGEGRMAIISGDRDVTLGGVDISGDDGAVFLRCGV
ncbi:LysM peptidoglycan-binding domain-containing protein [Roseovarius confluentis]|uniref:LysM peptidoglycan-binding domain-containing protein n=1 Tax=Roseovarius confluentis TaxID=1852027 RepID=UPI000CDD4EF4|nr:LysM peptidoglycan-binding domain-containing protein [Roseovarius confluentis]